jgi:hypothetical protein
LIQQFQRREKSDGARRGWNLFLRHARPSII